MFALHHVSKTYQGKVDALIDVDLTVADGEFVFLIGPSGSGKSTLMKMLTREVTPDTGEVVVCGTELTGLPRRQVTAVRRQVGHVFQDVRLLSDKTVAGNVAFALRLRGASRSEITSKVPQLLDAVGLADKAGAYPHELSGGQQQRVAIARAISTRPSLLLCDEPTGNLDPDTSMEILDLLDRINQSGCTVLMSTHDVRLVDHLPRRVIALKDGQLVRDAEGGYDHE